MNWWHTVTLDRTYILQVHCIGTTVYVVITVRFRIRIGLGLGIGLQGKGQGQGQGQVWGQEQGQGQGTKDLIWTVCRQKKADYQNHAAVLSQHHIRGLYSLLESSLGSRRLAWPFSAEFGIKSNFNPHSYICLPLVSTQPRRENFAGQILVQITVLNRVRS